MKDLFDAISTRVKEPYWGFFLLSFLAFNWRGLFLLFTSSETAQQRIALFDLYTNLWSLLVCPISTALIMVLITPWLKVLFGKFSRIPYEILNSQELNRKHAYLTEEAKLEQLRLKVNNTNADLFESQEKELIERAKRDLAVKAIEDENVKASLQKEINELRAQRNQILNEQQNQIGHQIMQISPIEKEILKLAAVDKNAQIMRLTYIGGREIQIGNKKLGMDDNREFLKYDNALESLINKKLIHDISKKGEIFELTHKGWELISTLNFAA